METFTNGSKTVLKQQKIPIYSLGKSKRFFFSALSSYTKAKSRKEVIFSISNSYNSKIKELEILVHIFK